MTSRLRRAANAACSACVAALLCSAPGVQAQTIYKLIDANGRITYTDRAGVGTSAPPASAPGLRSVLSLRQAAGIDAQEAARALAQAQLYREQGTEPLPGELARGAAGGAVGDRYWERQEKLRRTAESARRRYNETRLALLAYR